MDTVQGDHTYSAQAQSTDCRFMHLKKNMCQRGAMQSIHINTLCRDCGIQWNIRISTTMEWILIFTPCDDTTLCKLLAHLLCKAQILFLSSFAVNLDHDLKDFWVQISRSSSTSPGSSELRIEKAFAHIKGHGSYLGKTSPSSVIDSKFSNITGDWARVSAQWLL